MKTFYISLVRDLIGCYLEVEAESEAAVRRYLMKEYFDDTAKLWKIPWCGIYTEVPDVPHIKGPIVIKKHGPIF